MAVARSSTRRQAPPPVLVRVERNGILESVHRGDIVEVDPAGRIVRSLGDPDRVVTLRSCAKPFGLVTLIEAGGIEAFELTQPEIAVLASSHSGEDLHIRTIQGILRRARVSQQLLACGTTGMPLDELTAARLGRDGERPGAIRHMCSGQHSSMLLLARLRGWPLESYWLEDHPVQLAWQATMARALGVRSDRLVTAIDGCGVPTFAVPLREVARAYAMLADPMGLPPRDPRLELAPALTTIRDAMLANPEMIAGTHDRLDTSVMKTVPRRLVSKGGMEALRGVAILGGPRHGSGSSSAPSGLAIKIEDGGGYDRASWAATIEALQQVGVLAGGSLRELARYHRPPALDPHGRLAGESVAGFELVPVGELVR